MKQSTITSLTPEMERCAVECLNTHSVCLRTVGHCLRQGGKYVEPSLITLLLNCAEICQTAENLILRGDYDLAARFCAFCAEVCEQCSERCRTFGGDPQINSCAEVSDNCAHSCRNLIPSAAA